MTAARIVRSQFEPNEEQKRFFWNMMTALFSPITEHHAAAFRKKIGRMVSARPGAVIAWDASIERTGWRHRKFMAMIGVAFDAWDPEASRTRRTFKGVPLEKSFEDFRYDVVIMAGYYTAHYNVDGTVRLQAKSISFADMDEEEFEELYDAVAKVLLSPNFLPRYNRADLDRVVDELVGFVNAN